MPGSDNPYRDIHRDGIADARNAADVIADYLAEYSKRDDPDLYQGPGVR